MIDAMAGSAARMMADFALHLAHSRGGRSAEWDGVVYSRPHLASAYRNLVVPLRPLRQDELPALAYRLKSFYGDNVKWVVWDTFSVDLTAVGLHQAFINPVMWRPAGQLVVKAPAGLAITPVRTDAEVRLFERMRHVAYGDANGLDDPARQLDARMLGGGCRLWLGWLAGEAVATAAAFQTATLNAVKHICTLEAHRGKRIGAAMTAHAVNSSPLPAILDSDPDGRRLYPRLGFTTVGTVRYWRPTAAG